MKTTWAVAAAAAMAFASAAVLAGEDSTDKWGAGGTGVAFYETNCGLHFFPGPVDDPKAQRPCGYAGSEKDVVAKREAPDRRSPAAGPTQPPRDPLPEPKDR
jgi:hypothetical protein